MTQLTGRQAKQAQMDAWQDRHGIQAYKTVPMTDQTAQAIYRDHTEALEMNANGDAGRAAFLGMTQPLSDTDRVAAALHVYADAVKLGQLPIPRYLTTHAANIGFRTFMAWADNLGLPIDIITSEATDNAYGRIMIPADPAGLLPDYVTLRITATSERLTDARHADIATHNAQCTPIDLVPEEINRYSGGF